MEAEETCSEEDVSAGGDRPSDRYDGQSPAHRPLTPLLRLQQCSRPEEQQTGTDILSSTRKTPGEGTTTEVGKEEERRRIVSTVHRSSLISLSSPHHLWSLADMKPNLINPSQPFPCSQPFQQIRGYDSWTEGKAGPDYELDVARRWRERRKAEEEEEAVHFARTQKERGGERERSSERPRQSRRRERCRKSSRSSEEEDERWERGRKSERRESGFAEGEYVRSCCKKEEGRGS